MLKARRAVPVTVLAAALVVTASACGGSAHPAAASPTVHPSTTPDPLKGLTSLQIARQALADTEAAPNVHLAGTLQVSGQSITMDLTVANPSGCAGTVTVAGEGSIKLIEKGTALWIMPDKAFWASSMGATKAAEVVVLLDGRYLSVSTSSDVRQIAAFCSLKTLFGSLPTSSTASGLGKSVLVTVDGQPAVKVPDTADTGYADVSDTAKPALLEVVGPGANSGSLTFSYPATTAITPPPASDVIDGSQYGL
jgi:hypothetical protein